MGQDQSRKDQIAQRRQQVAANRLGGMTEAEIARILGVSQQTVSRDLKIIRDEWAQFRIESMETMQNQTARRYDILLNAVWSRAAGGNLQAIFAALKIESDRRKLLGLDAPFRVQTEEKSESTISIDVIMSQLPSDVRLALIEAARQLESGELSDLPVLDAEIVEAEVHAGNDAPVD